MKKYLKISILIDNPNSWFHKHIRPLLVVIRRYDPKPRLLTDAGQLKTGDVLFILSCDKVLGRKELSFHNNNIVIHASDLPKGRGWSPWTWQVEAGAKAIPLTLFEAGEECDAGDYFLKDKVCLDGLELVNEIRARIAEKIINMTKRFLESYPMKSKPQKGKATHYRRRSPADAELDVKKSIKSQFNKFRVADNKLYPVFFRIDNCKYVLRVSKERVS